MANTAFLLETKFNFNPLLQQTFRLTPLRSFPSKLSSGNNHAFKLNYTLYKGIGYSPKLSIKCFFTSPKAKGENGIGGNTCGEDNDLKAVAISSGINDVFRRSIKNIQKALQFPVITGVLLALLFLYDHHHGYLALAASGGRMGGSSFSSSSSSRGSPSSSISSSSSSSSSSSTRSKPSYPSSSSSPSKSSFSSSSSYKRPESSFSSSSSSSTWPTSYSSYSSSTSFGGDASRPSVEVDDDSMFLVWIFLILGAIYLVTQMAKSSSRTLPVEKTSILKLQVGLSGTGRSLQNDLNRIAETADTSTPHGLSYILQETTRALLRNPDYCISGYSSVDAKKSIVEVETLFNQLSIEERSKFDEETLVNVNNIRNQSATTQRSNDFQNEYLVITIIVAAGGVHKLPPINSTAKLKEALQNLTAIPSSSVKAVEVLWTPLKENDILTEQEYLEDYPLLRPL